MNTRSVRGTILLASTLLGATLASACDKPTSAPDAATAQPAQDSPNAQATISSNDKPAPGAPSAPSAPAGEQAPAEQTLAAVGQPAPDFTLKDQAGVEHTLSAYKGKIVVLEWTNPECPYVVRHYKADTMIKAHKELGPQEVVWLAIDSTKTVSPASSERWRAEEGFEYPVLQDPDGVVGKKYGAKTTPHMYVIDAQGALRYAGAIDDDPREQVQSPRNYVIEAVKALQAGRSPEVDQTKPYGCSVKYKS